MARFKMWDARLLGAMGIAPTQPRRAFLQAWAECEGGEARFNPLNTTMRVHGSTTYNDVGVQHYVDASMGIAATLLTIRLPFYVDLVHALAASDLAAGTVLERSAGALGTWGTSARCVGRVLGREPS